MGKNKRVSLPKLSRPGLGGALMRKRLFSKLDKAFAEAPVVWISAPGGAGKTILLSSYVEDRGMDCLWYRIDEGDADPATFFYYLARAAQMAAPRKKTPLPLFTPEYTMGAATFALRFFEELFARFQKETLIVFDNYNSVGPEADLHGLIAGVLEHLPNGISVAFASRNAPKKTYHRLIMHNAIRRIDSDYLRLTLAEAEAIGRMKNRPRSFARALHERTQGWAAGFQLLIRDSSADSGSMEFTPGAVEDIYRYFSAEVLERLSPSIRQIYLRTSLVPYVTPAMATKLSGEGGAPRILKDLSDNNYFIERLEDNGLAYRYHPLFKSFLERLAAAELGPDESAHVRRQGAGLFEEEGRNEQALVLYLQNHDWPGAVRLLMVLAPAMLGQGRNRELTTWLAEVPDQLLSENPDLVFFYGMALQTSDITRSKQLLMKAFELYASSGNLGGAVNCWCSIVDTVFHEWNDFKQLDHWVERLEQILGSGDAAWSRELEVRASASMLAAMTMRGGNPEGMKRWAQKALGGLSEVDNLWSRLQALIYCFNYVSWVDSSSLDMWVVDTTIREAMRDDLPPLLELTARYIRSAILLWREPDVDSILDDVNLAIEKARNSGVHVWDEIFFGMGVFCAVMLNDRDASSGFLRDMEACVSSYRKQGLAFFHYLKGWDALVFGAPEKAEENIRSAISLSVETGYYFPSNVMKYGAAVIHAVSGKLDEALAYAQESDAIALEHGAESMRYSTLLALSFVHLRRQEKEEALDALREALEIGRLNGYCQTLWWWYAPMMSELMALAIREDVEREYAVSLVQKLHLVPPSVQDATGLWPWPVKIFTLGGFSVVAGDSGTSSGRGKARKPLELLKFLVSGRKRTVRAEQIIDALWSDSEGDAAYSALSTTLSRLRKIIGEKTVFAEDGNVGLDPSLCWVDAWELSGAVMSGDMGRVRELYRGEFLPDEQTSFWSAPMRERLRNDYLAVLTREAEHIMGDGDYREAVTILNDALAIDPLSEDLYQLLMKCYISLGLKAETVRTYERCFKALMAGLGVEPSKKSTDIYNSVTS